MSNNYIVFFFSVYGNGLQTWEYSPNYAIRSYMPLWLFAVPAKMLSLIMNPVSIFYAIRTLLGVLTAMAEFMFYKYEFSLILIMLKVLCYHTYNSLCFN